MPVSRIRPCATSAGLSLLTRGHLPGPNHPTPTRNTHIGRNHPSPSWGHNGTQPPPATFAQATISVPTQKTMYQREYKFSTLSVFGNHPFFFSWGHRFPNVIFLASFITMLLGSSITAWWLLRSSSAVTCTMAHPQLLECFACSIAGISSASQPSRDFLQRKQEELSMELAVGR